MDKSNKKLAREIKRTRVKGKGYKLFGLNVFISDSDTMSIELFGTVNSGLLSSAYGKEYDMLEGELANRIKELFGEYFRALNEIQRKVA